MFRWQAVFLVLVGAASYGFLAAVTKIGYRSGFHLGELIGSQMFVGVIVLWLLALWRNKGKLPFTLPEASKLIAVGTLSGMTGILYYVSIRTIPASLAIVLLFQFVWVGVWYEWIFERKKPSLETLMSVGVSLFGGFLASGVVHDGWTQISLVGVLAGLVAAFSYAGTLYASGKAVVHMNPWFRSSLMGTGAMLLVWGVFPPYYLVTGLWWNVHIWIPIALGIMGLILPMLCFVFGAPKIGTQMTTLLCSVELPIAIFMARFVFMEAIGGLQWLGVCLIVAGLIMKFMFSSRTWKVRALPQR
ncbi:DMT family transporter [Paenibacillus sp. SYP-B3998]|uniref:DMT family transporter n=1 Tax=Paenibacillus sp. SYP-B3998 TaxID=2678564 RepID=A0A6G3ZY48_9BACL|nr:DMT family transporter [Paenibacillus sp. SYP-B3998]NEW06978.1 DMT family transporter [Paenibacillus sp. SYP-B3998]